MNRPRHLHLAPGGGSPGSLRRPHSLPGLLPQADWQALLGGANPLSPSQWQQLDGMVQLRRLHSGEVVFLRDQTAQSLVAVCQGMVGLGQTGEGQQFRLERSLAGPQWLDLHSAWLGELRGQNAWALRPTLVLDWPLALARPWLEQHPAALEQLLRALAAQVRELTVATHDLMHKDANGRVAAWLLQHAGAGDQLRLAERKREIAAQLGITPETLSRVMRQLSNKELVKVQGYRIDLLDRDGLQKMASGKE